MHTLDIAFKFVKNGELILTFDDIVQVDALVSQYKIVDGDSYSLAGGGEYLYSYNSQKT